MLYPRFLIPVTFILFFAISSCQAQKEFNVRPRIQHIIKTPFFGAINPFYPELQLGYGFQKADKWAIHVTGGWVNGLYYNETKDQYYKRRNGWRASATARLMLTHDIDKTYDHFLGLKYMESKLVRTVADFFWDENFNFKEFKEVKNTTNSYSILAEYGFITNYDKRFATELFFGLGAKTYRRINDPSQSSLPQNAFNVFESLHQGREWESIPTFSFSFNLVYRLGRL